MLKVMAALTGVIAVILALGTSWADASDFTDMRGVWTGKYLAVAPQRDNEPGPRFNDVELKLDIKEQKENVFWGTSTWRIIGRDAWNERQVTGSVSLIDPGAVTINEVLLKPEISITGLINGAVKDGKLFVTFRGLRTGTSFSTVLKKDTSR